MITVTKGSRIRASWFDPKLVSLAGVQMKVGATKHDLVGVVKHVRGDHPTTPKEIRFYVDAESDFTGQKTDLGCSCGHAHVEINPAWVTGLLNA